MTASDRNLFTVLQRRWPTRDRVFLHPPQGEPLTYGDLETRTGQLANALVACGVKPGDRVAAQVDKSPEAFFLYLACLRAGAAFLPLNTAYTLAELEYFIADAEPALVVCRPDSAEATRALCSKHGVGACHTLDAHGEGTLTELARSQPMQFDTVPRSEDDLAAMLYTSGTTGRAKGAMLTHRNLASNAEALAEWWRFTSDDVLLHALPIFHTHGLFVASNVTLWSGAAMIFLPRFDADEIFRCLPRATAMMGVPTFYVRMVADPRLNREATAHMRVFISGSAPLLPETFREFETKTGHRILERYGMTETSMNSSNPYEGNRVPGAVGFALPGVEIRVTEPETGVVLPQGEIGMIEVRGPNVFKGYWRMPEKTAAEIRGDGFFITGDLGKFDAAGYLHIVGRSKDLVISGGFNVYPKEVESEIDEIPGVVESAVIGVAHPDFGEGVAAIVVAHSDADLSEHQVIERLRARLAAYKVPKRVIFVDAFPRNAMGKVQKNVLRDTYKGLFSAAAA